MPAKKYTTKFAVFSNRSFCCDCFRSCVVCEKSKMLTIASVQQTTASLVLEASANYDEQVKQQQRQKIPSLSKAYIHRMQCWAQGVL